MNTSRIQGTLLRRADGLQVAIYLRDGVVSVAEFRDGTGELRTAGEWMSVDGRRLVGAQRRGELDAGSPIPGELAERIERLHRNAERARSGIVARALARLAGATPAPAADPAP